MPFRFLIMLVVGLFVLPTQAQSQADTLYLGFEEFLRAVAQNHPIAQQADLFLNRAEAALLSARGGFDPLAEAGYKQKSFDEKNYYQYLDGGIRVPAWWGIEVKAGYKQTDGVFLNPEASLPELGQAYLGISFPLLQGMLIDANRANIKKAKAGMDLAQQDQNLVINQLLFDAAQTYWTWFQAEQELRIFSQAYELAEDRFFAIKESFLAGDRPAMDTLESWIQVQDRLYQKQMAEGAWLIAKLELSLYRWDQNGRQVVPSSELIANNLPTEYSINTLMAAPPLLASHPMLRQLELKGQILDIERRLKIEKLKPKLNLEYQLLGDRVNFLPGSVADQSPLINALLLDNYTAGVKFSIPLFLREARGDLRLTDIKIQELGWKTIQKRTELQTKLAQQQQAIQVQQDQQAILAQQVNNYQQLLDLERQKLMVGESSIFLINSRENKLIDAQQKLLSAQVKTIISFHKQQATAATMTDWIQ